MPRVRLDRVTIVRSALVVAERQSIDELTLSAVAEHLGVGSPALYNHLESLDELRYEVALHSAIELNEHLRDAALGHAGEAAIEGLAGAYRRYAHQHPAQFASTLRPPQREDDQLANAVSKIVDTFRRVVTAGFALDEADGLACARAIYASIHGFLALEIVENAFGTGPDVDRAFERLVRTLTNGCVDAA